MEPQPVGQFKYEDGWRCFIEEMDKNCCAIRHVKNTSLPWRTTTDLKIFQIWQIMLAMDSKLICPGDKQTIIQQIAEVSVRHNSQGIIGQLTRFYHRFLNLFGFGLTKDQEQKIHSSLNFQNTQPPTYSLERPKKLNQYKGEGSEVLGHDPVSPPVTSLITDPTVKKEPTNEEMDEAYEETLRYPIEKMSKKDINAIKEIENIITQFSSSKSISFRRDPNSTGFRFFVVPSDLENIGGGDPRFNVLFEQINGEYCLREYVTKKILDTLHAPVAWQKHLEEKYRDGAEYDFLQIILDLGSDQISQKLNLGSLPGLKIEIFKNGDNIDRVLIVFDESQKNYETFCDRMRSVTEGCIVLPKLEDVEAAEARNANKNNDDNPVVCDPNVDLFVTVSPKVIFNGDQTPKIEICFEGRFANLLVYGRGDGCRH